MFSQGSIREERGKKKVGEDVRRRVTTKKYSVLESKDKRHCGDHRKKRIN